MSLLPRKSKERMKNFLHFVRRKWLLHSLQRTAVAVQFGLLLRPLCTLVQVTCIVSNNSISRKTTKRSCSSGESLFVLCTAEEKSCRLNQEYWCSTGRLRLMKELVYWGRIWTNSANSQWNGNLTRRMQCRGPCIGMSAPMKHLRTTLYKRVYFGTIFWNLWDSIPEAQDLLCLTSVLLIWCAWGEDILPHSFPCMHEELSSPSMETWQISRATELLLACMSSIKTRTLSCPKGSFSLCRSSSWKGTLCEGLRPRTPLSMRKTHTQCGRSFTRPCMADKRLV